jgi:2-polyprenyl-3-methyl-5-hydroxy-6-metoxy-1,4-benzoquinol methylase
MYLSFPARLLDLVRCPNDQGRLTSASREDFISEGVVNCASCNAHFPILEGILNLLGSSDAISAQEIAARDKAAGSYDQHFAKRNEVETAGTLEGFDFKGKTIVDLGCGTGRITTILLDQAKEVLAIDFSIESLRIFARKVNRPQMLGLVLANAAGGILARERFEGAISTQVLEHLPTMEARNRFLRQICATLKPSGRFVVTAYHHSLLHRYKRESPDGFHPSGIYYHRFTKSELRRLMEQWFTVTEVRPIQVPAFFASNLGLNPARVSRWMEKMPALNLTGHLLKAQGQPKKE